MLLMKKCQEKKTEEAFEAKTLTLRKKDDNLEYTECLKSEYETSHCWQFYSEVASKHLQKWLKKKSHKKDRFKDVIM